MVMTYGQCRFCAISKGQRFFGEVDLPILRTSDFLHISSIGALIEGWSLIVPRFHCVSLLDFFGTPHFSHFLRIVWTRVEATYGKAVIFEHGANKVGSLTSCGTDHAHLHVVPLVFSMLDVAQDSSIVDWQEVRTSEISSRVRGSEYLFFSESECSEDPLGYLHVLEAPTSQFFRKLIAARVGKQDIADYKSHQLLEVAELTRQRLSVAG